ncbi:MAG: EAL domain-containing protein [Nitrospirota bacterium]
MIAVKNASRSILLIEDNRGDAELIRELLADRGSEYALTTADRLGPGLELLDREPFDIVLLDLGLPDSSGIDTLGRLQAKSPELPVIVMTGIADEECASQAIALGAQDYLVKGKIESDLLHRSILYAIERKKAEQALRESEERYRVITETAQDAIVTIDEESRIVLVNPAVERMFGYVRSELVGSSLTMLMPERLRRAHCTAVKRHIATGKRSLPWDAVEMPGLHRDGGEIPLEISYGEFVREGRRFFIGIVRDITERKRAEETITYQAYHDLLTGLANRTQLMLKLDLELPQANRNHRKLAVLHIDIDRFRAINDSLGHAAGDKIILAVAERLRALVRKSDTLARIGSDEFIILLPDLNRPEDAALFARTVVETMQRPFTMDGRELYATASVGISMYPEDSEHAGILLKNADIAVSYAKERGRNNYQFFNSDINVRTIERLLLESDLRQSLERGELELRYQPQVSIRTGEIVALEALVRWRHPVLGLLGPVHFIPVAEDIGFITAIDEWVLREACMQARTWQDTGCPPLCVTVNVSAQKFQQPTLVESVADILKETGLAACYLDIEITESTAMSDIELAVPNLKGLYEMGVDLSIDDFGTGYSSLNYLKRFPVHKLKIDQSFIRGIPSDADDQAIVNAVIAMGHNLRLKVIAEGVETEDQLSFLRFHDCDEMQGYLFSEPLPPERIEALFAPQK